MAIECSCQTEIKASPAECVEVAADAARWKEWARDLERVRVIEEFSPKKSMRVEIAIEILGVEKSAIIDVVRDPDAHSLTFEMVSSPSLGTFFGAVRFAGNGSRTRMTADVHATLLRPTGPRTDRMASRKIETALTRDFLRFVERSRRG